MTESWDLVRRYDRPVPRYTSYPTVPVWREAGSDAMERALANLPSGGALSVYVHLPFCDRMCLYCGCNVVVAKSDAPLVRYLATLAREIEMAAAASGPHDLAQLHYGGGTPTMLSPAQLEALTGSITSRFRPTAEAEMSIEIDPMTTTREHLEALRRVGFNRLSLGVQDFDDHVQRLIERNQTAAVTREVYAWAREVGFTCINMDLMYGLPGQTPEGLASSCEAAAELGADRIALFAYAHVPGMKPHQRRLEQYGLPTARARWEMAAAGREVLQRRGYVFIGMDHFARQGDELVRARAAGALYRNFQGYTIRRATHLLGLGASAISDVGGSFIQSTKRLSEYHEAIAANRFPVERGHRRTRDDELRRAAIIAVMCDLRVDAKELGGLFGIDFDAYFAHELGRLAPLESDGLVRRTESGFEVTELGRGFLRNIACIFDAYLDDPAARPLAMSRAV
jgi:oxygen-independent coproporphyrinogen III oxidase